MQVFTLITLKIFNFVSLIKERTVTLYDGNVIGPKMKNSWCPLFSFVYSAFNANIYCNASNEVKEAFKNTEFFQINALILQGKFLK